MNRRTFLKSLVAITANPIKTFSPPVFKYARKISPWNTLFYDQFGHSNPGMVLTCNRTLTVAQMREIRKRFLDGGYGPVFKGK